jgi:hypothetical protein
MAGSEFQAHRHILHEGFWISFQVSPELLTELG